ncbi:MAG: ABC transporter ATP-binding protein [Spirochaetia bacterium]|nr:ABC transporter ATP-binding protein [Spirochaetia bacterium]MCF7945516.1 ABC transporter ATP-binding protein [Spirochaetia bacterium]
METILDIHNLKTSFKQRKARLHAVNGISFSLMKGEMLGVVGESGCGKSVSMLSIVNLLPPSASIDDGEILFDGKNLRKMGKREIQHLRGKKIGMIFQDPMTSLNPVMKIGNQMNEALRYHNKMSKEEASKRSCELLRLVGISNPAERLNEYPHQLSGGMRQRVMIAMALTCDPEVIIADEPTTALDVTIQAQIVELIKELREKLNSSIILITHDLGLLAGMVDRIIVMYAGFIVEEASVDELYRNPSHPYTIGLLKSIPKLKGEILDKLPSIDGSPPDLLERPSFCPFAARCPYKIDRCWKENPQLEPIASRDGKTHKTACWVDVNDGETQ